MINLAIIAYSKEVFTTMTFEDVFKLNTVRAIILIAFDTCDLLCGFKILLAYHSFALSTVNLTAYLAAKLVLAFETCSFARNAQLLTAILALY